MCLFLQVKANCAKLFGSDVFLRWKLSAEPSSCLNYLLLLKAEEIPLIGYVGSITFPNLSPYSTYRVEVGIGNDVGYNPNSFESNATTLQSKRKYSWCIFNSQLDRKTQLSIELNYILLDIYISSRERPHVIFTNTFFRRFFGCSAIAATFSVRRYTYTVRVYVRQVTYTI